MVNLHLVVKISTGQTRKPYEIFKILFLIGHHFQITIELLKTSNF